jgi:hypothetical protein
MEYPRLTEYQLTELERRIRAAEEETASLVKGEALTIIEYSGLEYLRRLIEDVKFYRDVLERLLAKAED